MADRRLFLVMMLVGLAGPCVPAAFAKDGEGGGGGGGSGGGGGGDGGGGEGGGNGNGGNGGGDDGGRGNNGKGGGNDGKNDDQGENDDDDKIRAAVRSGQAEPLRKILSEVRRSYKGQVIRIRLTGKGNSLQYRIRMIDQSNNLIEVRVNAKTARIVGAAGL